MMEITWGHHPSVAGIFPAGVCVSQETTAAPITLLFRKRRRAPKAPGPIIQ